MRLNPRYYRLLLAPAAILAGALAMAAAAVRAGADAPMGMAAMAMPASAPLGAPVNASTVVIQGFAFGPNAISVPAGATVTWINHDNEPHSVVMVDQSFRSPPIDTGEQFTHTFATPGQYRYFCGFHPYMVGVVIVRAAHG